MNFITVGKKENKSRVIRKHNIVGKARGTERVS